MPKVYVVNRPVKNKFGWVPDLSDATRYGTLEVVFEPEDKPQYVPGPSIQKARRIMKDFSPEDYVLWPGGGDPIAVMISCMIASERPTQCVCSAGSAIWKRVKGIAAKVGICL